MDNEYIINMAREAGLEIGVEFIAGHKTNFESFAAIVSAHEREACAKLCEEIAKEYFECFAKYDDVIDAGKKNASSECAAAIRARS